MLQRGWTFLAGLFTGLLSTGLLLLFLTEPSGHPVELRPPPTPGPVRVHVAGAVATPGVYELPAHAIVEQAIEAAGGPLGEAELDVLNLAAVIEDGEKIYLPSKEVDAVGPSLQRAPAEEGININAATAPELEQLPGIGPALAQNIVDYRETHGPFLKLEDLLEVSGIGPAKLEQIQDLISLP
jgi:competence protein ComEA